MKCSQCGRELTAAELEENKGICPECGHPVTEEQEAASGENQSEEKNQAEIQSEQPKPASKKKTPILAAAALIVVAAAAAFFLLQKPRTQSVSAEDHINPTALAYITDDAVGFAKGDKTVDLYLNEAEDESTRMQVTQMMSSSVPYIGDKNYFELDNGDVLYIPLSFTSMQDMTGKLYLQTAAGEEKVLDEDASIIYCHSDNAIYYNKVVDGKLKQVRYQDGELTPMEEIVGESNIIVTKASNDGSLLQVVKVDDQQSTVANGYFYNGKLHWMEENDTVFNIAKEINEVIVMEVEEDTGLVNLHRVKDLETGELEPLGSAVTEAVIYDDGSLSFLGDVDIEANVYNPVGSVYLYDPQKGTAEKVADNAVAILESDMRKNGWMNENGRDLTTSEISREFERDKPLYAGQVHYIDGQGNLCASSAAAATVGESGLQGFVICENFYDVNNYSFNQEVTFATNAQDSLYWSVGADLYRYQLGSMKEPQVIPLNESVEEKTENDTAQVGYLTSGSGDIVEETQETLVLKKFSDEESVTLLENVGKLNLSGLDNDGKNIYFISEDGSLYSKSVESRSNPKLIDSNVVQAQATSEGLYYMVKVDKEQEPTIGESGEETYQTAQGDYQYNLMLCPYGSKKSQLVREDVNTISALYIQQ